MIERKIGATNYNTKGTLMKIVDIRNDLVTVEFQDKHKYRMTTIFTNFKTGCIKNPYDKTIVGVGYIGVGKYRSWENGHSTLVYAIWKAMITRCYYEKDKDLHRTYYDKCTVCEEWHNFQVFAEWYERESYLLKNERLHLDKDILIPGNKIYSPETCLLVPHRINLLFMNKENNQELPNGITTVNHKTYHASYRGENLGTFKTLEEAYLHYSYAKEENIKMMADKYKDVMPSKVYNALLNYRVDINLDKNYMAS